MPERSAIIKHNGPLREISSAMVRFSFALNCRMAGDHVSFVNRYYKAANKIRGAEPRTDFTSNGRIITGLRMELMQKKEAVK